jgi:hypothetical protein
MSSCQDELFARRDPPDYEVKCVYCGLTAMRSTMYSRVGYRQYSCRDTEACKERLRTEIASSIDFQRDRSPTRLVATLPADFKIDRCDACGAGNMQEMSGCKRLCRKCGYMRTCNDTV